MTNDNPCRILVVAHSMANGVRISALAEDAEVICDVIYSIFEIAHKLIHNSYNGLMIDMDTLSRIRPEDRPMVDRYRTMLTYARYCFNPKQKVIEVQYKNKKNLTTFAEFANVCRRQPPRKLRGDIRKRAEYKVSLKKASEKVFLAYTKDISEGGCFIVTDEKFKRNSIINVTFKNFKDKTPIIARVAWIQKQASNRVAGIGVNFTSLSDRQFHELMSILFVLW